MKVYYDDKNRLQWIIERDNGEKIVLSYNEVNALYWAMRDAMLWEEVDMRIEGDPDLESHRAEIEVARESILEYMYRYLDVSSDVIYDAIDNNVDLDSTADETAI